MAISRFVDYQRPLTPAIDLQIAQSSMNKIQEGSEKALEYDSALRTAVAELDLNPAEDGFRQGLVNEIETASAEGNDIPYYALPQLIKTKGNIFSSPALTGRLKAQQAYKQNMQTIQSRNDITDEVKEYAIAMNPYHYEDKYDDNGNVIGGTEWTPNFSPVRSMDFNEVLKLAAQYVTPDSGGGSNALFRDANGQITNDVTQAVAIYSETDGRWEKLTSDKLLAGVYAAMNANPQYAASLQQDYKVLEWKLNKGEEDSRILDKNGNKKSFDAYVSDMIDPFIRAREYNNKIYTTKYHDAAFATVNKPNSGSGLNKFINPTTIGDNTAQSHNIEVEDKTYTDAIIIADKGRTDISELINKLIPDNKISLDGINISDIDALRTVLTNNGITGDNLNTILKEAQIEVNDNIDYYNAYNDMLNNNTKETAAYIMYNAINNGIKIDDNLLKSNPYLQKYQKDYDRIINSTYIGHDNIGYITKNKNEFDRLIGELTPDGKIETAEKLGYKVSTVNGKYIVSLNNENKYKIVQFENAFKKAYEGSSTWRKIGQSFARQVDLGSGLYAFDNDDTNYIPVRPAGFEGSVLNAEMNNAARSTAGAVLMSPIRFAIDITKGTLSIGNSPSKFVKKGIGTFNERLQRQGSPVFDTNKKLVSGIVYNGATPEMNTYAETMVSPYVSKEEASAAAARYKNIKDMFDNLTTAASIDNTNVMYRDENGNLIQCDSAKKKIITDVLLNTNDSQKSYNMLYNPYDGTITPQITIKFKSKEENPLTKDNTALTFTTDGLINNDEIKLLNNSDEYFASSQLYRNSINNSNTNIGYYTDDTGQHTINISPLKDNGKRDIVTDSNAVLQADIEEDLAINILKEFNSLKRLHDIDTSDTARYFIGYDAQGNPLTVTGAQYKNAIMDDYKEDSISRSLFGDNLINLILSNMF